jgi:hypothetical protein
MAFKSERRKKLPLDWSNICQVSYARVACPEGPSKHFQPTAHHSKISSQSHDVCGQCEVYRCLHIATKKGNKISTDLNIHSQDQSLRK